MVLSNSFSGFLKLVCLWLFFTCPFFIGLKWPAKGGCKEPFKWGEQGGKSETCQITQELDWKVVAATHPNLKFLVQLVVNMYGGGQERVTTLSSAFNKTCWRLCHGLGRHFTRLVLEIEIDGIMNTESFDLPCGKHLIATNSFNILEWSQTHCQCKKE